MKIRTLLALFGLFIALFTVMGCDGDDDEATFAISGTVVNAATGSDFTNPVTVRAVNNGVVFSSTTTSTGDFTVGNLPAGSYLLYVTDVNTGDQFVYGPVAAGTNTGVVVPIQTGVTPPPSGNNATLAFGFFDEGVAQNITVDINGDIRSGNNVVYELAPGTYDVTVNVGEQTFVYENVVLTAGARVAIVQVLDGVTPPDGLGSFTGTVRNVVSGNVVTAALNVLLYQNGQPATGSPTAAVTNGAFGFTDILPGTYQLIVQGSGYLTTFAGTVTVTDSANPSVTLYTATIAQAQSIFPGLTNPTTTGTAIVGIFQQGSPNPFVTADFDGEVSNSGPSPLLFEGLADPTGLYNVTLTVDSQVRVFGNVPIPAGQITLITAEAPPAV